MNKLYAIGELLIDFTPTEQNTSLATVELFTKNAGGAPANVAAVCAKLGQRAALITQVGQDAFGDFLVETLKKADVDTNYIVQTVEGETSLAFVSLTNDGGRDFLFYRRHAADLLYNKEQLPPNILTGKDILHFCSVNLVESPMKHAHVSLIEQAHQAGSLVSFDPNVRLPLWNDEKACRQTILEFLPKAHIVKLSEEELLFLTAMEDEEIAVQTLFQGKVQVLIITRGAEGASLYTNKLHVKVPADEVHAIDTTGAGDAFIGGVLSIFLSKQITAINLVDFCKQYAIPLLTFANRYAGASTEKHGAIASYLAKHELSFKNDMIF
ncbi:carbohydrate kinase [Lysinibacillus agricola]|uniref:Carbohydrate kinase n=1 Tax=Lysinibacillus agricola TaxID=2590012 RepID=A0ABX7AWA8_9BACI|nr:MULTISPECIES: carbohydrate kinase [Lysinibacillus]KOS63400.1 fructokinase [Lysinibacillus sp. FJAT-14222]QQP14263.1 carbohydrate kinase [Lysinibacillus agricola]